MLGTLPNCQQSSLFSNYIVLERRIRPDHPLRQVKAALDLSFVIPLVKHRYGRCGNRSLDPRVVVKLMFLLFYYNIPSERELMAQLGERLDFLWFLDYDLESAVPDPSVLSKARAHWGKEVFEALFVRSVEQCVEAGLVDGRLLHADSTTLKANASKDSVVKTSPELVKALRAVYQQQEQKLVVLPKDSAPVGDCPESDLPTGPQQSLPETGVNQTHISRTDPEAQLARTKTGLTDLSYKEHRLVDDAKGVITAVVATASTVGDASQLPSLIEQHRSTTHQQLAGVTVAGDHHYGSASNYLFCAQEGLRAHLAPSRPHLKARGKIPLEEFVYEPQADRLRCPAGHYLVLHQNRPEVQAKSYLIEEARWCAECPLRQGCTSSVRGRSLQRHVQTELLEELRQEAQSGAGRYNRKRRKHVMEGSFADAANNHRAKRSRWRGLWKQQLQSWMIAAVQNLRLLLRQGCQKPRAAAAANSQPAVNAVSWFSLREAQTFDFARFRPWQRLQGLWQPMKRLAHVLGCPNFW